MPKLDLSGLDGLIARPYGGKGDHAAMAGLLTTIDRADGIDSITQEADVDSNYRHLENSDPATDMVMVWENERLAGYSRSMYHDEIDGPRVYACFAPTHPDHRPELVERLLDWSERRTHERLVEDGRRDGVLLEAWAERDRQRWLCEILERRGFEAVTYGAGMVRESMDGIPDEVVLPDGVRIRPVEADHLRPIWEADKEAFRDHWGASEPTEEDWGRFLDFPHRDETLWRVAWAGDRVVGQVRSFIDEDENRELGRKRGYTEFISTARAWRNRGIARALIHESIRALRDRGMEEAALGVHTENPNGAFHLYESVGFRVEEIWTTYRKPVG